MKHSENMADLFDRLNELKYLFHYGQKIIPIIQSLIDFMKDTVPLLDNINTSISDTTRKIPKATHHINDVTFATELATTEILDIVDMISGDVQKIEKTLKELIDKEPERKEAFTQLKLLIGKNPEAEALLDKLEATSLAFPVISPLFSLVQKIKNDSYNITLSLQVQDITSQQLAAVNHLIGSVQERLATLVSELQDSDIVELETPEVPADGGKIIAPDGATFDPNASYSKQNHQQKVDDIINDEAQKTSQAEIDKLFS